MNLHQIRTHPEYQDDCFGCRAATVRVGYCNSLNGQDKSRANRIESELERYANAVRSGMQPEGTTIGHTIRAEKWSDRHGEAYSFERAREKNKEILREKVE